MTLPVAECSYNAAGEVRETIKQYATRGIVDLGRLKKLGALNQWDKVQHALLPVSKRRNSAPEPPAI